SVTTAPVVPTMKPDEIAVRNVLDQFLHESTEAYANPDPNRASLLSLLASPYKEHIMRVMTDFAHEQSYFKRNDGGVPPHRVNSVRFDGLDAAIAFECLVDDRFTYKVGSTEPVDTNVSRLAFKASVIRDTDGRWRINGKERQTLDETAA